MSDAVRLAREVVANDVRDTWSLTSITLARAVIAQSEELAKLRAERDEARAKLYALEAQQHAEDRPVRTKLRLALADVADLRAALAEACRGWSLSTPPEHLDVKARIAELRKLANGG